MKKGIGVNEAIPRQGIICDIMRKVCDIMRYYYCATYNSKKGNGSEFPLKMVPDLGPDAEKGFILHLDPENG